MKNRKFIKIMTTLSLAFCVLSVSAAGSADTVGGIAGGPYHEYSVYFEVRDNYGALIHVITDPIVEDGVIYLPFSLVRTVDYDYETDGEYASADEIITIVHRLPVSLNWDYSISASVDIKNGEVTRDGKTEKLSGKYLYSGNILYIPIEDLEKIILYDATYNDSEKTIKFKYREDTPIVSTTKDLYASGASSRPDPSPSIDPPKNETVLENKRNDRVEETAGGSETAAERLLRLGIISGDPNGDLRLGDSLTRAEMSVIICKLQGINDVPDAVDTVFGDVNKSHWASGYINAAYNSKIINGNEDGTFRPEDKVTYQEAVKMLVSLLGYAPQADMIGGYPEGYLETARRHGLTSGVELGSENPCTRGDVFILAENALDIPLMMQKDGADPGVYVICDGTLNEKGEIEVPLRTLTTEYFGEK